MRSADEESHGWIRTTVQTLEEQVEVYGLLAFSDGEASLPMLHGITDLVIMKLYKLRSRVGLLQR